MNDQQPILIVDDDTGILSSLRLMLKSEGFVVNQASQPAEALFFVKQQDFALVLMDLNYSLDTTSGQEGFQLIEDIKKLDDTLPIVVMTGWGTIDIAVLAMQKGAGDFIQKPWQNDRLLSILHNQIKLSQSLRCQQKLSAENQLLKQQLNGQQNGELIAESTPMKQLLTTVEQVANTTINLLITGENGTGKSLLARYIHQQARVNNQAFVAVNMGAISESLFESEMFGHVKGAFTDAKEQRIGRFELANNGSLFLDEIGNIPYAQQAKLLRVIEDQQFEKVGSSKTQTTHVRIISATNADLNQMVQDKTFRMDLLYRLNTLELKIPPLRERQADIVLLAQRFIASNTVKYHKPPLILSAATQQQLCQYPWPGNIRELQHLMERLVLLFDKNTAQVVNDTGETGNDGFNDGPAQSGITHYLIEPQHLMLPIQNMPSQNLPAPAATEATATQQWPEHPAGMAFSDELTLEEMDQQLIIDRLNRHQGNAISAAKSLGLSRSAFYRRLDKYKI